MRAIVLPAVALVSAVAIVLVGGRMIGKSPAGDMSATPDFVIDQEDIPVFPIPELEDGEPTAAGEVTSEADGLLQGQAPVSPQVPAGIDAGQSGLEMPGLPISPGLQATGPTETAASRMVVPEIIVPPEFTGGQLSREMPRKPLGESRLAPLTEHPVSALNGDAPVEETPDGETQAKADWAGKPLFRPVAIGTTAVEAMGHRISIAGVAGLEAEETCDFEGTSWPCGVRARAAFRSWLRGRALVCEPQGDAEAMTASCRLANQDVGGWLVENGWARAAPGGSYAEQGEKARAAGRGIFGGPPDTASLSPAPDLPVLGPVMGESQFGPSEILDEGGADPQPELDPRMEFPPAPPAPVQPAPVP